MKRIKIAGVLFSMTLALQLLARMTSWFGPWYAQQIYPLLVHSIARLSNLFPFSVVEWLLYIAVVMVVVMMAWLWRQPFRLLEYLSLYLSLLLFLYTINCGINYYGEPFSNSAGFTPTQSSGETLYQMCELLTEQVNDTYGALTYQTEWNQQGVLAMQHLGTSYASLSGYYPRPKAVSGSKILSVQQLGGVYSPFTIEANYNSEMPAYQIPHTICHELSHLKGFMREDEANFIGYLACIQSDSLAFQYSGYLTGWVYAAGELAKWDIQAYRTLYEQLDPRVVADLRESSQFWNHYDGVVAEAAVRLNDTYLKWNEQTDGVKSYGRMVDLMLAYHQEMLQKDGQK